MAGIVFDLLSASERTALPFLRELAETDLSANAILSRLKENGLGIRRSNGLSIISQLRNVISTRPYVANVGVNKQLTIDNLPTALTDIRRNFSYEIRIDGRLDATGEKASTYVTVTSDELLTKQEALDIAADYSDTDGTVYGISYDTATVTQVLVKPGYSS